MQKNKEQKEIELIKCIRDTKRRLNTANKILKQQRQN